ncbi:hypothetical protein EG68_08567 [Paragonimus skrjabini miyazakii]|uniref:CCZ1/INTU/HSP4 first Longin domain-containing protein n=1 Tax=Paragonimus skrjabini miyazakii TaxID=59628 RepID=A0A8S9YIW9_9TREM|nr:hypothetical protein EG68_08567 [Paragonimus skrjabini miyazakii]
MMFAIDRPRISEFFVHCPSLCEKEGDEHKKILYYFPSHKAMNERLNSSGLCEAVMTFTKFFDTTCRTLHTSTTRRFFHQMSDNLWIVMLFNGKVPSLWRAEGVEVLKCRLEHFFSRYLRSMLFEHCDMLECFNGIQFTSTEPADFSRIQGLVNRIRFSFRCIKHVAFFYDGRLAQSTLDLDYARHLYHYLNSFMFVERPELSHAETTCKTKHLGRFLVGPKDLSDSNQTTQCPILCSPGSMLPDSQLVTYQALRVVLCLVVHGVNPIPREFFVQFDTLVGPRLTVLADRLAANQSSTLVGGNVFPVQMLDSSITPSVISLSALNTSVTQEEGITPALEELTEEDVASFSALGRSRFLYWNPCTYAVLTTLHVYTGSGRRQVHGAKLLLDVMISLRSELQLRPSSWHEEITVRMDPHIWLVARRSNGREVYMIFMKKQENLAKLDGNFQRI